ncbi:hypothetical protein FOG18_10660 [Legionella israelensis]|uniref:hypothetical protein n=1 Tax=Legionella israelensis TaxID=454 RepID=UPI00117FAA58|nr:hypothetical protein [Legionella israelensis]QDP72992.1 hypothetical protein FOG18_10660 [Legionella israelensis]
MEPVTIAVICAVSFGGAVALVAFIRQLLLSRDKHLNDKAQQRALAKEVKELEKMRLQMETNKRFDSHYKVLGSNKDAIVYLDNKIEEILQKKFQLIDRYSQVTLKESAGIIDKGIIKERMETCDRLKKEIDKEISFYDNELKELQKRRSTLWDTHTQLQEHLIDQEMSRNKQLDELYRKQTGMLEKIFIRHIDDSENITRESIKAGTSTFKMLIMAPVQFLLQFFKLSNGISLDQVTKEKEHREDVSEIEKDINGEENDYDEDEVTDEDIDLDKEAEFLI